MLDGPYGQSILYVETAPAATLGGGRPGPGRARSAGPGRSGNLPAELSSFVGRERELLELRRLIRAGRVLTLTGPGGVGKSRLALRSAARLRRDFPDGCWLVELADLRDPGLLARAVAAGLGVREAPGQPVVDTLTVQLGERRLLLVLDNCERLLGACAALLEPLLASCPGVHVLVTSRQPLQLPGERVLAVPSLPVPAPGRLPAPAELAACDAVVLLVQRGAAATPGFTLTTGNAAALAEICRRLDGLPLAIELAAVRLRVLSPLQLLDRLAERQRLPSGGSRSAHPRHATLQACIEWSYDVCSRTEQLLWSRLTVFCGGFELDAAEQVCAGSGLRREDVAEGVARLAGRSVLLTEESGSGVRYRMLETVREYAGERLAGSGEAARLRRRHQQWCEHLAQQLHREWISDRQEHWLTRMRLEQPNLRAALDHCLPDPDRQPDRQPGGVSAGEAYLRQEGEPDSECAARILVALPPAYLWAQDLLGETRHWLARTLSLGLRPGPLTARVLVLAAQLSVAQGDLGAAAALLTDGWQAARHYQDPAALALAGYATGCSAMYAGDPRAAIGHFQQALETCAVLPTLNQRLDVLLALGVAAGLAGDEELAERSYREILQLTEPVGERFNRSNSFWALGLAAWTRGDRDRATRLQRQAVELKWQIGDRLGTALSVQALAWAAAEVAPEHAATLLGAAEALWQAGLTRQESQRHLADRQAECVAAIRRAVSEPVYRAALERGRRLDPAAAVGYALGLSPADVTGLDRPRSPALEGSGPAALTVRERQVAELVADGRSNQEIADALGIARRTAEGHVARILEKLGFGARTQIVSWIRKGTVGDEGGMS